MDCINRTHILILGFFSVLGFEIHDRQCTLPVMSMENVGIEAESGHHLQHCLTEECISFSVIKVSVHLGTLEIILVVDKVICHAVLFKTENAAILLTP